MKGDALVGLAAVIVVEIKAAGGIARSKSKCQHGYGICNIHLTCGGDAAAVKDSHYGTRSNAELLLKLAPAANGESIELIVINETLKNCSELCH